MTLTATRTKRPSDSFDVEGTTLVKRTRHVNAQIQSPLFRLPREIRNHIFEFALAKSPVAALLDSSHDNTSDAEPELLYTCHRTRDEALPVYYQTNDWIVKTRRVGSDTGRLDPVSKRLITFEFIPRWLDCLPDVKINLIRNIIFVGSRGSYVNVNGKWREGERAAFRLKRANGRMAYNVEEVHPEDDEHREKKEGKEEKDIFCSVQLIDLLRARMRINIKNANGNWTWTKDRIHDLAVLL